MRISDWSSDVCSSDLRVAALVERHGPEPRLGQRFELRVPAVGALREAVQEQNRRAVVGPCDAGRERESVRGLVIDQLSDATTLEISLAGAVDSGERVRGEGEDRQSVV